MDCDIKFRNSISGEVINFHTRQLSIWGAFERYNVFPGVTPNWEILLNNRKYQFENVYVSIDGSLWVEYVLPWKETVTFHSTIEEQNKVLELFGMDNLYNNYRNAKEACKCNNLKTKEEKVFKWLESV